MSKKYNVDEENPTTAVGTIFLIAMIKNSLVQADLDDDYTKQYKLLKQYFFELARLVDEKKKKFAGILEHHNNRWMECRTALSKINQVQRRGSGMLMSDDLLVFDHWLYELKRLEQKCGIGLKGELDIRDAMGES